MRDWGLCLYQFVCDKFQWYGLISLTLWVDTSLLWLDSAVVSHMLLSPLGLGSDWSLFLPLALLGTLPGQTLCLTFFLVSGTLQSCCLETRTSSTALLSLQLLWHIFSQSPPGSGNIGFLVIPFRDNVAVNQGNTGLVSKEISSTHTLKKQQRVLNAKPPTPHQSDLPTSVSPGFGPNPLGLATLPDPLACLSSFRQWNGVLGLATIPFLNSLWHLSCPCATSGDFPDANPHLL